MESTDCLFLTRAQNNQIKTLDYQLQKLVEWWRQSDVLEGAPAITLFLDIIKHCHTNRSSATRFFNIFKGTPIYQTAQEFEKVKRIAEANLARPFFAYCDSEDSIDPSVNDLIEAIHCFEEIISYPQEKLTKLVPFKIEGKKGIEKLKIEGRPSLEYLLKAHYLPSILIAKLLEYLTYLPKNQRLPLEDYEAFFDICLKTAQPIWSSHEWSTFFKLTVVTTSQPKEKLDKIYALSDLKRLLAVMQSIHQSYGSQTMIALCQANLKEQITRLSTLLPIFQKILSFSDDLEFREKIDSFVLGNISFAQIISSVEIDNKSFDPVATDGDIETLFLRFTNDPQVEMPLDGESLKLIKQQYYLIQTYCSEMKNMTMEELGQEAIAINHRFKNDQSSPEDIIKLVAIGRLGIRLQYGIFPYSTQIIALLGLLHQTKGTLAQVKTGEGKSVIVALMVFVLAMQHKAVDVVSSSEYLAKRDQERFDPFYRQFNLTNTHICKHPHQPQHFAAQILYGSPNNFEFALMHEKIKFEKLFELRNQLILGLKGLCGIVDEVDNMTLDTLMNSARMALPNRRSYEWVYPTILKEFQIKNPTTKDLKTTLEKNCPSALKSYFKEITDKQFEVWKESAMTALQLKENVHYVIKKNANRKNQFKTKKIIIVDEKNTGALQPDSRWGGGLHEMIEAKHGLRIQAESLTPISLSHVNFYNRYDTLYGLTGTLGGELERNELKKIYDVSLFDVPSHLPSQRIDAQATVCSTQAVYQSLICQKIITQSKKGRPVLVICQSIEETEKFAKQLHPFPTQLFNEMQLDSPEKILQNAGKVGVVTIATLTAARGTDIVLEEASVNNQGLHVIITFFPQHSERVLAQMQGRSGRQGQPGSSEMIILSQYSYNQLLDQRNQMGEALYQNRIRRANTERYTYRIIEKFYYELEQFDTLSKSTKILLDTADHLAALRLTKKIPFDDKALSIEEKGLSRRAFALLYREAFQPNPLAWKNLLEEIGEKIKQDVLELWSIHFFQRLELLNMNKSDMDEASHLKAIDVLFQEASVTWNSLIDPLGKGFVRYLKKITNQNFEKYFVT